LVHESDEDVLDAQSNHRTVRGAPGRPTREPRIDAQNKKEDDMEQLLVIGEFFSGLGMFFIGIGVLWFVTVYKEKTQ
jgi:hypothetical protein